MVTPSAQGQALLVAPDQAVHVGFYPIDFIEYVSFRRSRRFVGKFDVRLDAADQGDDVLPQRRDFFRERALHAAGRPTWPGQRRIRTDQIVDRFRLENVDPPGEIRPEREFAGQGRPGALPDRQPDDFLEEDGAPVQVELDDVFAGVRSGPLEIKKKAFVERPAVAGIDDRTENGPARDDFGRRRLSAGKGSGRFPGRPGRSSGRCRYRRAPAASRRPRSSPVKDRSYTSILSFRRSRAGRGGTTAPGQRGRLFRG